MSPGEPLRRSPKTCLFVVAIPTKTKASKADAYCKSNHWLDCGLGETVDAGEPDLTRAAAAPKSRGVDRRATS